MTLLGFVLVRIGGSLIDFEAVGDSFASGARAYHQMQALGMVVVAAGATFGALYVRSIAQPLSPAAMAGSSNPEPKSTIHGEPFSATMTEAIAALDGIPAGGTLEEQMELLNKRRISRQISAAQFHAAKASIEKRAPKASTRAGDTGSLWYLDQIPNSAPLAEQLEALSRLRDDRDTSAQLGVVQRLSESAYLDAKQRLLDADKGGPDSSRLPSSPSHLDPQRDHPEPDSQTQTGSAQEGLLDRDEIVDALRQIKALHEEGILTDEEYEAKRKKLADKL